MTIWAGNAKDLIAAVHIVPDADNQIFASW